MGLITLKNEQEIINDSAYRSKALVVSGDIKVLKDGGHIYSLSSSEYSDDGGTEDNRHGYLKYSFTEAWFSEHLEEDVKLDIGKKPYTTGGKTYYPFGAQINSITVTADNTSAGTVAVLFDGDAFYQVEPSTYMANGNRNTTYIVNSPSFFGARKGWTRTYTSTGCTLKARVQNEHKGTVYIENLNIDVQYGFRVLTSSPDGGYFSGDATDTYGITTNVNYGTDPDLLPLTWTTNDGYKFNGWNKGGSGLDTTINAKLDGVTVYEPNVTAVPQVLNLNGNGGQLCYVNTNTNTPTSYIGNSKRVDFTIKTSNSSLNFTNLQARKNLYTFTGWKSEETGTVSNPLKLNAATLLKGKKDASLQFNYTAQFTANACTYVLKGRTNATSEETYQNYADNRQTLPSAQNRIGYTFTNKWRDLNKMSPDLAVGQQIPLKDSGEQEIFEAIFTPNEYTFSFVDQDGNTVQEDMIVESGTEYSIPYPKKPGFSTKWIIEREGSQTTLTHDETKNHTVKITSENALIGDRTYTAIYDYISYTIDYKGYSDPAHRGNGQSLEIKAPNLTTVNIKTAKEIKLTEVSYPGYEFIGWVDTQRNNLPEAELNMEIIPNEDPETEITGATRTFIAYFKPIQYEVDFKYNSAAEDEENSVTIPDDKHTSPDNYQFFIDRKTMTVESNISNQLIQSEAVGYNFDYWNIYVDNKLIKAKEPNITPRILTDSKGEKILGKYTYEAIYKPMTFELFYDSEEGRHKEYVSHERTKLRRSYRTNKTRYLNKTEFNEDIYVYRPGFEFTGFSMVGAAGGAPVKEYELPAHEYAENLSFNLNFRPHNITITAIPKLYYNEEFSTVFPEFQDEDKNGVPYIIFTDKNGRTTDNGQINIEYYDGVQVKRTLVFDEKRYVFKGWQYPGKSETDELVREERDLWIDVNPTLNETDLSINTYYAIFEYVDYSIEIHPLCTNKIASGQYGAVLVGGNNEAVFKVSDDDKITLPDGVAPLQNSVQYESGYVISNLHYRDEIELAMIPYIADGNYRHEFIQWDEEQKNSLLKLTVNEFVWPRLSTVKELNPLFSEVEYRNSVTEGTDSQVLTTLLDNSIPGFILINAISELGDYGFYECDALKYAFLPGVKKIGSHAFQGCSKMKTAILSSEEVIGETGIKSFDNCSDLNLLIFPNGYIILNDLFDENDTGEEENKWSLFRKGMGRIYVPSNKLSDYISNGTNWFTYANIIRPIPETRINLIYKTPEAIPDEEVEEEEI